MFSYFMYCLNSKFKPCIRLLTLYLYALSQDGKNMQLYCLMKEILILK